MLISGIRVTVLWQGIRVDFFFLRLNFSDDKYYRRGVEQPRGTTEVVSPLTEFLHFPF